MISKKAAVELYDVLRKHVPQEKMVQLLNDLSFNVAGNQSYRDTVQAMIDLHEIRTGKPFIRI